jgi:hypothetical protein
MRHAGHQILADRPARKLKNTRYSAHTVTEYFFAVSTKGDPRRIASACSLCAASEHHDMPNAS